MKHSGTAQIIKGSPQHPRHPSTSYPQKGPGQSELSENITAKGGQSNSSASFNVNFKSKSQNEKEVEVEAEEWEASFELAESEASRQTPAGPEYKAQTNGPW